MNELKSYYIYTNDREGYLRTTCFNFDLDDDAITNKFVHLTNNAVQKLNDCYGMFENGNQLSFKDLEAYLARNKINMDFRGKMVTKIKEHISISMCSVRQRDLKGMVKGGIYIEK